MAGMMRWKWTLVLASAAWCPGCEAATSPSGISVTERDSAGIAIVEIDGDAADLPLWRLGPEPILTLPGSEPPYFSSIGEVEWLSDDRLVVEDNQHDALYLFGADGTYVRQVGDKGDGPGQYQNMTETTVVSGDTVYVYDRTHDRLSVVHPDAGFIRSIGFDSGLERPPLDVFALGPRRILVQVNTSERPDDQALPIRLPNQARLYMSDGAGTVLRGPVTFPGSVSLWMDGAVGSALYGPRAIVAVASDRVVHGTGERFELTFRDAQLNPVRMVRWSGWSEPVPDQEFERLRVLFMANAGDSPPAFVRQLMETQYSRDMLPAARPALDWRSYIDADAQVWVSAYHPPGLLREAVPEWYVLSAEGAPLWRLELPMGSTLAAVQPDRVALIVRDEMDVQSLAVHSLVH